jgi:hypothetical protein
VTLAIGVKYPYGRLYRALASLPKARFREAVILMSDSRWTYSEPQRRFEDVGTKVFALDNSTAITYSGDVRAGEHCITELQRRLRDKSIKYVNITETLQRIYKYHKNKDSRTLQLLLLMGKYLRSGETKLIYFKSPKFEHVFITGIKGIGDGLAFNGVFKAVGPQIDDLSIYTGNTEKDTSTIAMLLAGAMNDKAIRSANHETVGGPVQYVVIDRSGVHTSELSWTTDPTGAGDTWHRVTARVDEITTYRDKYGLSLNFVDIKNFGLHSYCD